MKAFTASFIIFFKKNWTINKKNNYSIVGPSDNFFGSLETHCGERKIYKILLEQPPYGATVLIIYITIVEGT